MAEILRGPDSWWNRNQRLFNAAADFEINELLPQPPKGILFLDELDECPDPWDVLARYYSYATVEIRCLPLPEGWSK